MPAGQGPADREGTPSTGADRNGDAERLAAAIDQGRPPGSVGGELARDLDIVAMLRTRGAAFDPHPDDRARAKQKLMAALMSTDVPTSAERTAPLAPAGAEDATAVIGRVFDEPESDEPETAVAAPVTPPRAGRSGRHSLPTRPAGRSRSAGRPAAKGLRRRAVLVGAAALVALVTLAGLGSFASRDALPGDALYAMKRLSESTGLALTFDDAARAQQHLVLATTRINEVEQIVGRGTASDETEAELLGAAMRDFDASTGEGSRMLLATDDASGPASLADLRTWAADQAARLSVLRSSLPEPAVTDADSSIALLDRLLGRAEALEARSTCSEVTSSVVDDLGRLPAEGTCSPRTSIPDDPTTEIDESSATTTPGGENRTDTGTPDPSTGAESGVPGSTDPSTPDGSETSEGGLPQLGPDGLPLPDVTEGGPSGSDSGGSTEEGEVSVPLPLVPPIQLPPLLPGLPSVTIG